ncbi:MAG: hypothetical protein NTZ46_02605 [Verrucomicrobia bacterium]|nr:hypothetical protein [Verrucomicrobiota bacterium]
MSTPTASEQIEQLERQIQGLKKQALIELHEQLAEARKTVADLEKELAQLTGKPAEESGAAPSARRTRRQSISDEELKPMVLKAMAQHGMNGLNAKEIAARVGQDPLRIRKFIANNPTALKRQGAGPGTRFFLP